MENPSWQRCPLGFSLGAVGCCPASRPTSLSPATTKAQPPTSSTPSGPRSYPRFNKGRATTRPVRPTRQVGRPAMHRRRNPLRDGSSPDRGLARIRGVQRGARLPNWTMRDIHHRTAGPSNRSRIFVIATERSSRQSGLRKDAPCLGTVTWLPVRTRRTESKPSARASSTDAIWSSRCPHPAQANSSCRLFPVYSNA